MFMALHEGTVVPPYLWFHFPGFQLPAVNHGTKILNGKFQRQTVCELKITQCSQ